MPGSVTTASDWIWPVAIIVPAVIGILAFVLYMVETRVSNPPRVAPIYHSGDMVKMRAFNQVGMIINAYCPRVSRGGTCDYSIRFNAMQLKTATRLFGSDGPVKFSPVALVYGIEEFEIEPVQ